MILKFKKLHEDAVIPKYQKPGDAGFDFHALIKQDYDGSWNKAVDNGNGPEFVVAIPPKYQFVIKTGLACVVEEGYEMQIRPRSGLAFKKCITITNSPGTLDSGYRGEIMIILYNLGEETFYIKNGDRIGQGVISPVVQPDIIQIDEFSREDMDTDRGGGLGSTGV
jgi:dUTP pyrophosphatase